MSPEMIKDLILPTLQTLGQDPIPNIRFNVAKALESIVPVLKKSTSASSAVANTVKPILTKLVDDPDVDVRYFGGKALAVC